MCAEMPRGKAEQLLESLSSIVFTKGKHSGHAFTWARAHDPSYHRWLVNNPKQINTSYRLYVLYCAIHTRLSDDPDCVANA